jgi:hypothetical protein
MTARHTNEQLNNDKRLMVMSERAYTKWCELTNSKNSKKWDNMNGSEKALWASVVLEAVT